MVAKLSEPTIITEADIDPGHNWKKALAAPGVMAVDFEERINFQRLHRYRLARTRQALKNSELGAVLCFDANNIRYMTSTNIGERLATRADAPRGRLGRPVTPYRHTHTLPNTTPSGI